VVNCAPTGIILDSAAMKLRPIVSTFDGATSVPCISFNDFALVSWER
jgi:hypothetical protein